MLCYLSQGFARVGGQQAQARPHTMCACFEWIEIQILLVLPLHRTCTPRPGS